MTPQELKDRHPDVYAAWYAEGYDKGVALGREEGIKAVRAEMLAAPEAARNRTTGQSIVDAWFAAVFPKGLSIT